MRSGAAHRTVSLVLFLAAAAASPQGTDGQAAPDTLLVTLEDALAIAEANNPAYRQTLNNLDLNGVESRTLWANTILPSASLSLFRTGYTGNLQRRATDNFGNPIENPQSDWVFFSNTSQALSLNWRVQGASIFNAMDRQELTNTERELAVEWSWLELSAAVTRQYYQVQEQRELVAVERGIQAGRRDDLATAQRLFELARNSKVDVLRAELQIEQQQSRLRQQEAAYERALLSLRTRLGDPDLPPVRLAEEPLPIFDPSDLDDEALVRRADEVHPDLRQAEMSVESAELNVRQSRNAWWPNVTVGFSLSRTAQMREGGALFDVSPDEDLDQRFSVGLNFPFFSDYFGNRQSIQQAEVQLENQEGTLRQTRLQVEETVLGALEGLHNQYEALRLARRSLEIAREALELAREEYRMGPRTFDQLQQSVDEEASARREVIQARYGFLDALLDLESAVGAPVRGPAPIAGVGGG